MARVSFTAGGKRGGKRRRVSFEVKSKDCTYRSRNSPGYEIAKSKCGKRAVKSDWKTISQNAGSAATKAREIAKKCAKSAGGRGKAKFKAVAQCVKRMWDLRSSR